MTWTGRMHLSSAAALCLLAALLALGPPRDSPGVGRARAAPASPAVAALTGRVTMLRVNNLGTGYGGGNEWLDVEVVLTLDTAPTRAFGFQLRQDTDALVHTEMLEALQEAYEFDDRVTVEFIPTAGGQNGTAVRLVAIPNRPAYLPALMR